MARLRFQSEDDNSEDRNRNTCPLPDVVPFQRDRSVSLPEVPVLRHASEQEVGRELRRISDEFHSSFHTVRRVGVYETCEPIIKAPPIICSSRQFQISLLFQI